MVHLLLAVSLLSSTPSCKNLSGKTETVKEGRPITREDSLRRIASIRKLIHADQKASRLDSLFTLKSRINGFNGCVLVAQWGQVIYTNCFGYSDPATYEPLTSNSEFQLASVSKQFTAVATLKLIEQGTLHYDDLVENFFPGFPYHGISIRMLLSHRTGLLDYMNFSSAYWPNKSVFMTNNDVINMMITNKMNAGPPDRYFDYCNTNYCILAAIVEKVSGIPFPDFCETNLFKPLGMKHTWIFSEENLQKHPEHTVGFNGRGGRISFDFMDGVTGDKGAFSTVEDLFKWDQALYTNKVLNKSTLDEAFTPRSFEKPGIKNYGYGWRIISYSPEMKAVFHNGWWHGYSNAFFRGLNDKTTVIVLGNRTNFDNYRIQPILDILGDKVISNQKGAADEDENPTPGQE